MFVLFEALNQLIINQITDLTSDFFGSFVWYLHLHAFCGLVLDRFVRWEAPTEARKIIFTRAEVVYRYVFSGGEKKK